MNIRFVCKNGELSCDSSGLKNCNLKEILEKCDDEKKEITIDYFKNFDLSFLMRALLLIDCERLHYFEIRVIKILMYLGYERELLEKCCIKLSISGTLTTLKKSLIDLKFMKQNKLINDDNYKNLRNKILKNIGEKIVDPNIIEENAETFLLLFLRE
jgi:hypothetical protein